MEPETQSRFIEFLRSKWKDEGCPLCHEQNWGVQDKVFELREFGTELLAGRVIPVVPVTCLTCGNIVLVSAIVSGAVQKEPEAQAQAAPSPEPVR
jgi:hypothetical protein